MAALGFLFDLDGTLVDTDHLHHAAFNTLLAEYGRSITMEHFKARIMGGANAVVMAELFPDLDGETHARLSDRKEALFRDASRRMDPIAGLHEVLGWARRHDVRVGAVTNAPRLNAEHMLRALGLDHLIADAVVGEEIARPKPDPLPYLVGAERLGLPPARVVAFEDSQAGVRAAVGAGTRTVALTTGLDADTLQALGPALVIGTYEDPALMPFLERMRADAG